MINIVFVRFIYCNLKRNHIQRFFRNQFSFSAFFYSTLGGVGVLEKKRGGSLGSWLFPLIFFPLLNGSYPSFVIPISVISRLAWVRKNMAVSALSTSHHDFLLVTIVYFIIFHTPYSPSNSLSTNIQKPEKGSNISEKFW